MLPSFHAPEAHRRLAAALDGDRDALQWAAHQAPGTVPGSSRLGPALALRARIAGTEGPAVAVWQRELAATTAHRMLLASALGAMADVLGRAGVGWAPVKGIDTSRRVFVVPEERPTSDLDVLVSADRLGDARAALETAGWHGRPATRYAESYLRDEGYNWQARAPQGILLELHFRLWGLLPAGAGGEVMARSAPAPELGATARTVPLAAAIVLSAVHTSLQKAPRPLLYLWELHLLAAADATETDAAAALAESWGVPLPVALAAAAAAALWPGSACSALAARMHAGLRPVERRVFASCCRLGLDGASLGRIYLARLLSLRPSRGGVRTVARQVWAHPGVVEEQTPPAWPWWARRAWHVLRNTGATGAADTFRSCAAGRFGGAA